MANYANNVLVFESGRTTRLNSTDTITLAGGIIGTPIGASSPSTGAFTTLSSSGLATLNSLSVTGDASVGGDLTVAGDIVSRGAVDVIISDQFLDLAFGNTTTTPATGGLTVSMNRTAGFTASTVTTFVAGSAGVSNPTFTNTDATGSTVLAANDVVAITGSDEASNDGLYLVTAVNQNSFPQTVTVAGVGTAAVDAALPFCQSQFTADTGDTATAYKVDLAVLTFADGTTAFTDAAGNAYAKGTFLTAYATAAVKSDFDGDGDYQVATSTLQSAYNGGNAIVTASSNAITFTLTSGGFTVNGAGAVDIGNAGTDVGGFAVGTSTFDINATGALTLDGVGASNVTVTGGALTVSGAGLNLAGGSGEIDITTSGSIDVNGSGGLDMDLSGAASDISSTGQNLTIQTVTSGTLELTSAASLQATGATQAIFGDDTGTLDFSGSGAVSMAGTTTVAISGSGAVSMESSAAGIRIEAAASNDVDLQINNASFLLCDASANAVDISRNIIMGQTAASNTQPTQAVAVELTAGEALQQGELVYFSAAGAVSKADADGGAAGDAIRTPVGAAQTGISNAAAGPIGVGGVVAVRFAADGDGNAVGKPVYLSAANPGAAVQTAPSGDNDTVYQIGVLHTTSSSNVGLVLWQPALIADLGA